MGLFDRVREQAEAAVDAVKERLPGQHEPETPAAPATTAGESAPTTDTAAGARATPAAADTSPAPSRR